MLFNLTFTSPAQLSVQFNIEGVVPGHGGPRMHFVPSPTSRLPQVFKAAQISKGNNRMANTLLPCLTTLLPRSQ